jgi:hypothetical protein
VRETHSERHSERPPLAASASVVPKMCRADEQCSDGVAKELKERAHSHTHSDVCDGVQGRLVSTLRCASSSSRSLFFSLNCVTSAWRCGEGPTAALAMEPAVAIASAISGCLLATTLCTPHPCIHSTSAAGAGGASTEQPARAHVSLPLGVNVTDTLSFGRAPDAVEGSAGG